MINSAAANPIQPIAFHPHCPRGARISKLVTALARAARPSIVSAIITGRPTSKVAAR